MSEPVHLKIMLVYC